MLWRFRRVSSPAHLDIRGKYSLREMPPPPSDPTPASLAAYNKGPLAAWRREVREAPEVFGGLLSDFKSGAEEGEGAGRFRCPLKSGELNHGPWFARLDRVLVRSIDRQPVKRTAIQVIVCSCDTVSLCSRPARGSVR